MKLYILYLTSGDYDSTDYIYAITDNKNIANKWSYIKNKEPYFNIEEIELNKVLLEAEDIPNYSKIKNIIDKFNEYLKKQHEI